MSYKMLHISLDMRYFSITLFIHWYHLVRSVLSTTDEWNL